MTTGVDYLLRLLQEALDLTHRAVERGGDPSFWLPQPNSKFHGNLTNTERDPWNSDEAQLAFEMARLCVALIGDHLASMRKLLEPPLPLYGVEVLSRSVLESAALGYWLMDPQITGRQRVARAYLVCWDEARTAVRNAEKVGTAEDVTDTQNHRDAILARVDSLGLGHVNKSRTVANESLPSKTDRVTALLAGKVRGGHEIVYSTYSAVTHGEMTGVLSRRLAPPASGSTAVWTITPRQLTGNVELALASFGQLQRRLCAGGMGGGLCDLNRWLWEHNVGRRMVDIRRRLT